MAIETYGLTAATLEPYLTQLYGQYGNAGDGLSDTDVDTIIEDQAARVGAAIIKALGADGITNVAGDELASRNVRTHSIKNREKFRNNKLFVKGRTSGDSAGSGPVNIWAEI